MKNPNHRLFNERTLIDALLADLEVHEDNQEILFSPPEDYTEDIMAFLGSKGLEVDGPFLSDFSMDAKELVVVRGTTDRDQLEELFEEFATLTLGVEETTLGS